MRPGLLELENYFEHGAEIGIVVRGESVESCFANAAKAMFALTLDLANIHLKQVITFEFEEAATDLALLTWLNILVAKAAEHQLMFGDFRLQRNGSIWKATVAGEKWRKELVHAATTINGATSTLLSVHKTDNVWEASCVLDAKVGE